MMESQNAFSTYGRRWRIACWIMIAGSILAMAWGLSVIVAHGGIKGVNPAAAYAFFFGILPLLIGVIMLFLVRSQARLYATMTSSDHPALLRWQCTPDEASRFVAAEAIRLRISRRATLWFILALIAVGFGIAYIQRENFDWGSFFIGYAIIAAFLVFCYATWRLTNAAELGAAKHRANAEVIIDAEGLVTGRNVFKWRGFNWGLETATYEKGQQDVLDLVFLAGTIPGSAALETARTVAWSAGAISSRGASTQSHVNVRIPVTASKAEEVRQLLSTTISQQLLTPPVIP
jgi:hypothetical protein